MTAHDQSHTLTEQARHRIQQQLVVLLAPTGHRLPRIESDERALWVRVDHRRGSLRIHPRTAALGQAELSYVLAGALVELAAGPPPMWVRLHPRAGLAAVGAAAAAALAAALGILGWPPVVVMAAVATGLLSAGMAGSAIRRSRAAELLRNSYQPSPRGTRRRHPSQLEAEGTVGPVT